MDANHGVGGLSAEGLQCAFEAAEVRAITTPVQQRLDALEADLLNAWVQDERLQALVEA